MTPNFASLPSIFLSNSIRVLSAVKSSYFVYNNRLLRVGQFRIDRQRQRIGGRGLGNWKSAAFVAEIGEAVLQVERHRIVHLRADARSIEMGAQPVAIGD